ncbi:hypothetical protein BWI15_25065 [Kribbella sp. ALI-6-A]|uniref:hypothetical protein n=1 Tax=Kribbella sp. ALI-6-A TaxID=1933817 RepID=UPI00097BB4A9|nr:hypothetical protein [Kribbella sp. ALI-6-A]ONI69802.1 hypothetical protein BWI15_25065 [Kribbella sp. ALI-6-A]
MPGPTVTSDSAYVENAFVWARERALAWVTTDAAPGNLASYWAGYPSRAMFYSRDVCHQAGGAHLLGLDAENFAMLRHFARSATAARKWYPVWAFHFDGEIAALDYRGDDDFVREIPAVFDLTWRALEQYDWTGDRRWLDDPDLAAYYRRSVGEFVELHDSDGDGVPEAPGTGDIFVGSATYNEQDADHPLIVAADGIALQYAALNALGKLYGDEFRERATRIQQDFLATWWDEQLGRFARGRTVGHGLDFGWGLESSWIAPMTGLTGDGPRNELFLDFVEKQLELSPPRNIEAFSYLPEVFFRHGRDESAWRWLRHLIDSRDDYPEVSFTVVHHLVAGLLGLRPDAASAALSIDSHLPADIGWLTADHVRVGEWDLRIAQEGRHTTEVTVHSGPGPLTVTVGSAGPCSIAPGGTARVTTPTKDPS